MHHSHRSLAYPGEGHDPEATIQNPFRLILNQNLLFYPDPEVFWPKKRLVVAIGGGFWYKTRLFAAGSFVMLFLASTKRDIRQVAQADLPPDPQFPSRVQKNRLLNKCPRLVVSLFDGFI